MGLVVLVVGGHSRVHEVRVFNGDSLGLLYAVESILWVDLGFVTCWLGLK